MAGYFHYLGRVFTEKNSWYKMLGIIALQAITVYFDPQRNLDPARLFQNGISELNIPGLILYLLVATLLFGYSLQVTTDAMNYSKKHLPDFDFAKMFVNTLRFSPFCIVWIIYLIASVAFCAGVLGQINIIVAPILSGLISVLCVLTLPVIAALHVKDYSYRNVLNPLTPFRIFGKVAGLVLLVLLQTALLSAIAVGLLIAGALVVGYSADAVSSGVGLGFTTKLSLFVLLGIFLYFYNAMNFAVTLRICDITRAKLSDTRYLDDDYRFIQGTETEVVDADYDE